MNIILYFLQIIQYLYQQNCWLIHFICRYIPLRQWAYEDSQSPKYQKYKVDELPTVIVREVWDYKDFIPYLEWRYGKKIKPVSRRSDSNIPSGCSCPRCNAPSEYLYRNNGSRGQFLCKGFHIPLDTIFFYNPTVLSNILYHLFSLISIFCRQRHEFAMNDMSLSPLPLRQISAKLIENTHFATTYRSRRTL